MKRILLATVLTAAAPPILAADVGISISVGEPGFYGRLDIGNTTKPDVIYANPVIINREPTVVHFDPIYLHVPPGYEKHWRKHCHEYDVCGRPVYFVRDTWYERSYASRHHESDRNRDERRFDREDMHYGKRHGRHRHD